MKGMNTSMVQLHAQHRNEMASLKAKCDERLMQAEQRHQV